MPMTSLQPVTAMRPLAAAAEMTAAAVAATGHYSDPAIHLHVIHLREIDDQAIRSHGTTLDVAPATANRYRKIILTGRMHGRLDVLCSFAECNHHGMVVHCAIPDLTGCRIAF